MIKFFAKFCLLSAFVEVLSSDKKNMLCRSKSGICPIFGSMQIIQPKASSVEYSENAMKNESCCVRLDYEFNTAEVLPQLMPTIAILYLNRRAVFSCRAPGQCRASIPDLPYGFYEMRVVVISSDDLLQVDVLADEAFECSERSINPGDVGCGVLTMLSQKMNFFEASRHDSALRAAILSAPPAPPSQTTLLSAALGRDALPHHLGCDDAAARCAGGPQRLRPDGLVVPNRYEVPPPKRPAAAPPPPAPPPTSTDTAFRSSSQAAARRRAGERRRRLPRRPDTRPHRRH